jgi:cation diffusion facilitator CzcD-associated flavoprotein CzcO
LIAGAGVLSVAYIPDIEGRDSFEGESYHTGRWLSRSVDLAGKPAAGNNPH